MTQKTKTPQILPDDPMPEAARQILRFNFERMLCHEPGTRSGEDIEALHDMRVAVRRMRVAFEIFDGCFKRKSVKSIQKHLGIVTQSLGPVRDLDVFLEPFTGMAGVLPETGGSKVDPVLELLWEQRRIARVRMIGFLESERHVALVKRFQRFLDTEGKGVKKTCLSNPTLVREGGVAMIRDRLISVQGFETLLDVATVKELHRLRIAFKKLRYVIEFFQAILDPEISQVIDHLKKIQGHLGLLNDADTACRILQGVLSGQVERGTSPLGDSIIDLTQISGYLDLKKQERNDYLLAFPEVWEAYNHPSFQHLLDSVLTIN